jgi:hypothetical protein
VALQGKNLIYAKPELAQRRIVVHQVQPVNQHKFPQVVQQVKMK